MSSFVTEAGSRKRVFLGVAGLSLLCAAASPAGADEEALRPEAEATVGARLYEIEDQDNDFLAGFWDQYRQTRKKNGDPPWFLDAVHVDLGWARPDDTYLLRLERWSPNATNDRIEVDGRQRGLRLDVDYRRYRSEELRLFPRGTYQDEPIPPAGFFAYGTRFNPDVPTSQVRRRDGRFWRRRTGVEGSLRFRPDGYGFSVPVLAEASIRSGFEERRGYRQDRFLLSAAEGPALAASARFRGLRRETDQEVARGGGNVVVSLPVLDWTQDFDLAFESFREKARTVTYADVAASDPNLIVLIGGLRAFQFTPDTDRITASSRAKLEVGAAEVRTSGYFSHLVQANQAPLQRRLGLDKQEVSTWSAHLGVDVPVGDRVELSGFAKVAGRRNGVDAADFQTAPTRALLRRRIEVDAEAEAALRPAAGALVATGYRYEWIDRDLRYANPATERPLALVEGGSERHALYVRGRARLLRGVQVSGELGWEYAPERDYPTDTTYAVYLDGRASCTLPAPLPLTLSVAGKLRDGHGNGRILDGPNTETRKDLDRREWSYTASATLVPTKRASISLSFSHQDDRQDLPFVRFDSASGAGIVTFVPDPDRIHYRSDVKSVSLNAKLAITDSLELRHFESVHWVNARFDDRSITSIALESVNEIDQSIVSLGFGLGWQALTGLGFDLGYRLDQFHDDEERGPFSSDDVRHTFSLGATIGLDLFTGN